MRCKIKAKDRLAFELAKAILEAEAKLLVVNERRQLLSAEEVDEKTSRKLEELELELIEDIQYDLD